MSDSGLKWRHYKVNCNSQQNILSIDNIFRVSVSSSSPQLVKSIISPQPEESLEHGAERLFGPGPHLPPLSLQPPHPLLPPLGPHCSSSLLEQPGGDQETKEV